MVRILGLRSLRIHDDFFFDFTQVTHYLNVEMRLIRNGVRFLINPDHIHALIIRLRNITAGSTRPSRVCRDLFAPHEVPSLPCSPHHAIEGYEELTTPLGIPRTPEGPADGLGVANKSLGMSTVCPRDKIGDPGGRAIPSRYSLRQDAPCFCVWRLPLLINNF